MSVRVRVCICACVYMCVFPCLSSVCSLTLYSYFFFFLLLSFSLSLLCSSLSHSLALSLPTYDSEVRKKLSVFYAHTLLQANKPYWSLHKEPKPNVSCLYNSGEVGGVWKKKRLHLRLRTGIKVSLPTTGTQRYTMNCGLEAAEEKVKEKVCFLNVSVWRCIYITWTPSVWV